MVDDIDPIHPLDIVQATVANWYALPLFLSMMQGNCPSSAESYSKRRLDLNDLRNVHAEATYFVRVAGESMNGDLIYPGDVLVVDSTKPPATGKVVVVWLNGDYCVKRYIDKPPMVVFESSNDKFLPVYVHPDRDEFTVLGVVTNVVFKPVCYVRPC